MSAAATAKTRIILLLILGGFPLLLASLALNSYFNLLKTDTEKEIQQRNLKELLQFKHLSDGIVFFDRLLSKNLKTEKIVGGSQQILRQRIAALKKKYPDSLEFMVWNEHGELVEELSDQSDFLVFRKKLNVFLASLQEFSHRSFPLLPIPSREQSRGIRSFRRMLGPFISTEKIAESFMPSQRRRCFKLHGKGKHAYGWYNAGKEYSVFVFISHNMMHSPHFVRQMLRAWSQKHDYRNLYLVNENTEEIFPQVSPQTAADLRVNLGKARLLTPPELLATRQGVCTMLKMHDEWWAVAVQKPDDAVKNAAASSLVRIFSVLALLAFLLRCYLLVHRNLFASLGFKLMLVFGYTVAVPLMIFATVGFDYISQKQRRSENEQSQQLLQILSRFDLQFKSFLGFKADLVTAMIDREMQSNTQPDNLAKKVRQNFATMALMIFDEKGNNIVAREFSEQISDQSAFKKISADLLNFLNDRSRSDPNPQRLLTENSILAFPFANKAIRKFNVASRIMFYYQYALRNPVSGRFEYLVHCYWDPSLFASQFIDWYQKRLTGDCRYSLALYLPETGALIGNHTVGTALVSLMARATQSGLHLEKIYDRRGIPLLAAAFKGNELVNGTVCVMVDYRNIQQYVSRHKSHLQLLLLLLFVFSYCLYRLLHYQILVPVKSLGIGLEKFRNQEYSYRIALDSTNEFGLLASSIDRTLESLQEFSIARVVQEALLPDAAPAHSRLKIMAHTCPMFKLGGDYHDFIPRADGSIAMLVADVAGHGVQGAMLMSMARAVLMLSQKEDAEDEQLMQNLNQTFLKLRQANIRTMMTCLLVRFSSEGDRFALFNAGHCAPILIDAEGRNCQFIDSPTFPLGFVENRRFSSSDHEFKPGYTLVLYTDGFLESSNAQSHILGKSGLCDLLQRSFSSDLTEFRDRLFTGLNHWSSGQNDDLTVIFIRREDDCASSA